MKIGYSLSGCIKDIIDGRVQESDVKVIHTGTCFRNQDEMKELIFAYQMLTWKSNPALAEEVALRLYETNKIDQPRLRGEEPRNIGSGWWEDDDEVEPAKTPAEIAGDSVMRYISKKKARRFVVNDIRDVYDPIIEAAEEVAKCLHGLLDHEGERETNGIGMELDSEALEKCKENANVALVKFYQLVPKS